MTNNLTLSSDELIVDLFAGGGGASTGIRQATGREPDAAVNHDPNALKIYAANHPATRVFCEDVFAVSPKSVFPERPIGLLWGSPDCTFHSKARGSKPHRDRDRARKRRGLIGVIVKWMAERRPRVVCCENVEEFQKWGPLVKVDGGWVPDPAKTGKNFQRFVARVRNLGYAIEWRELRACDYGAPTTRRRLFIVMRCDGQPITFPEPTHGPRAERPYRTAAECIDWSIPCPSIFGRKKPLAEATLRRIARGVKKFVIDAKSPFVIPHRGGRFTGDVARSNCDDSPTSSVVPTFKEWIADTGPYGGTREEYDRIYSTDPKTPDDGDRISSFAPILINTRNGEREGQAPRVRDIRDPMPTVTAVGSQGAVVAAFLAKHYGGPNGQQSPGSSLDESIGTVTGVDHHAVVTCHLHPQGEVAAAGDEPLVASSIVKLKGTCKDGQPVTEPLATVQAQGLHYAEVRAFLVKFYGTGVAVGVDEPIDTVTTKHRFALVTVEGVDYVIVDIGMRMLTPRELYNAQGFPPDYVIDPVVEITKGGRPKRLSKTEQVHKCGNAVPPAFSAALVRAQFAARSTAVAA